MVWLQRQMPPTEEGQEQWNEVVQWLNEPPQDAASRAPSPVTRLGPVAREKLPKGTPLTAAQQASAFAAFQGTTGG